MVEGRRASVNVQGTITIEVRTDDHDTIRASVTMRPMVPALSLAGLLEEVEGA